MLCEYEIVHYRRSGTRTRSPPQCVGRVQAASSHWGKGGRGAAVGNRFALRFAAAAGPLWRRRPPRHPTTVGDSRCHTRHIAACRRTLLAATAAAAAAGGPVAAAADLWWRLFTRWPLQSQHLHKHKHGITSSPPRPRTAPPRILHRPSPPTSRPRLLRVPGQDPRQRRRPPSPRWSCAFTSLCVPTRPDLLTLYPGCQRDWKGGGRCCARHWSCCELISLRVAELGGGAVALTPTQGHRTSGLNTPCRPSNTQVSRLATQQAHIVIQIVNNRPVAESSEELTGVVRVADIR